MYTQTIRIPIGPMTAHQKRMIDEIVNTKRADYTRKHFGQYIGQGIPMSEAGRLADIPTASISRWASAGHIRIVGRSETDKRVKLVDKADILLCKRARELFDYTSGRRMFKDDGELYIP